MSRTGIDRIEVRPSVFADVRALQGKLRESDCLEIAACSGRDPDKALAEGFLASSKVWTGLVEGMPVSMFGVAAPSLLSPVASPWLLGTDAFDGEGIAIAKRSRHYVREMRKGFALLENYTDDRHTIAHRWLFWCGFQVDEPQPWGVMGLPFRRFWMPGLI